MTKARWWDKHYAFFCNQACEYFPCHETETPETFNCLFCYCPLYPLGADCGGACTFSGSGVKDCSKCTFPHKKENYGAIIAQFPRIAALYQGKHKEGGGT
ncbi:hypothetical protein D1159_01935 [Pseudoflavonifractor sp. 524-17]|nr:hypothetical protein [Pseudoflavonifractor sp. 524-17]